MEGYYGAPSPLIIDSNDCASRTQWAQRINKELSARVRADPPPAPQRGAPTARQQDLIDFCVACRTNGNWASAASDPSAATAMRALKRRVGQLQSLPPQHSQWALTSMNRRDGLINMATSDSNPLSTTALISPQNLYSARPRVKPSLATSLWCDSFGSHASEQRVDLNYHFTLERSPKGLNYRNPPGPRVRVPPVREEAAPQAEDNFY